MHNDCFFNPIITTIPKPELVSSCVGWLKIDIGVMPLTDDAWAKGKCGFKAIQYMSLGIPTIASDVGVNNKIIEHATNGFVDNEYKILKYFLFQAV